MVEVKLIGEMKTKLGDEHDGMRSPKVWYVIKEYFPYPMHSEKAYLHYWAFEETFHKISIWNM